MKETEEDVGIILHNNNIQFPQNMEKYCNGKTQKGKAVYEHEHYMRTITHWLDIFIL